MHEAFFSQRFFCQKTEGFSSNFQFTFRAKFSAFGRFLHFSQKVVGVTLRVVKNSHVGVMSTFKLE